MSDPKAGAATGQPNMPLTIGGRAGVAFLLLAIAIFAISIRLVWVGYNESDDRFYADAAAGWVRDGLFLGSSHWGIRHVIVLPMAACFAVFGESETTLVLPSAIYAFAVVGLLAHIALRLHGWLASAFLVAIAGSIPVVAIGASLVSTDLPEAFFVIGSVWAFDRANQHARTSLFLLSGAMAGVAAITRETAIALLVLYAVLFVAGRGRNPRRYLWLALGFVAVTGLDWIYLTGLSGDPLYRPHLALAGARGDGPQMAVLFKTASGIDRFGALDAPRWIKPAVALLLNQGFGLLFWIAVPATLWLSARGPARCRLPARLLGGLALTWVVVLGYGLAPWLWVIPRYFVVCIVLAVPLAIALADAVSKRRSWIAIAALVLLVGSNLALNLAATTDLMAGEHALVTVAAGAAEIVHTDPATARGAHWLLALRGLDGRVSTEMPGPGALYFFNNRPRRPLPDDWPIRVPPAGWVRLEETRVTSKWTGVLVRRFGLANVLPLGLVEKLDPPPHAMATYRVPAG